MTTLPRTTISPTVCPSAGTSVPSLFTTRNSPEVISSTPCRALMTARSAGVSFSCSGSGAQTVPGICLVEPPPMVLMTF